MEYRIWYSGDPSPSKVDLNINTNDEHATRILIMTYMHLRAFKIVTFKLVTVILVVGEISS